MTVYIAYYKDDKGYGMASSFGWTENESLALLYLKYHRLSADEVCKPCMVSLTYDANDSDSLHMYLRDLDLYPYIPDVNFDTEIRVIYIEDVNSPWDSDLSVVTTYDTIYECVGNNLSTKMPTSYNRYTGFSDALIGCYLEDICEICKSLHWVLTGGVVQSKWASDILIKAIEKITACNFASYTEFNSVKYCIVTGFLRPLQ